MKILVWHWGRRGAGPVFAVQLAAAIDGLPGHASSLSLAAGAEILAQNHPPACDWREPTYRNRLGYIWQILTGRFQAARLAGLLARIKPDVAICAMPALLDRRMVAALKRAQIPYAVVVHDAQGHPGEALNFWLLDQPRLLRQAAVIFPLTTHVATALWRQGFDGAAPAIKTLWHPPFDFGAPAPPPLAHGGKPRLLNFGRLLPYKGLDLLADALASFGPELPFELRICGDGPASADLDRLRAMPGVSVEHRWIPEDQLAGLIAWADAVVLPYREASQSGVAAAAVAQGRYVLATNVGGLPEQLAGTPGAVLCDPDAAAIAQALRTLFNDPIKPHPPDAATTWRALAQAIVEVLPKKQAVLF